MKKILILIIIAWYMGVCVAETNNRKDKTESSKELQSLTGNLSSYGTEEEKKENAPGSEPTYVFHDNDSLLEKQISTLEEKIAILEARIRCLEFVLKKQSMAIQTIWDNYQMKASYPQMATIAAPSPTIGFTKTPNNKYVFSANGARIEVDMAGNIIIKARKNITVESNATTSVKSSVLKLGAATMVLESSGDTHINSKLLRLNNGSRPVAGQGDEVEGVCPPRGGPLLNGSIRDRTASTVLVP